MAFLFGGSQTPYTNQGTVPYNPFMSMFNPMNYISYNPFMGYYRPQVAAPGASFMPQQGGSSPASVPGAGIQLAQPQPSETAGGGFINPSSQWAYYGGQAYRPGSGAWGLIQAGYNPYTGGL